MSEPSTSPQVSQTLGGSGLDPDTATVAALRQALTEGTITSGELTAFYLSRIERLNPALGAVISVSPDAAADARARDEARVAGAAPGPLDGIPVLIKDNIAVRGMPATAGSPALAEADQDEAFLVTRLREAGAVILGKANLSEWANFRSSHSTSGWSTLGGQAVNPHGPGRNPSGSSSGSGVAVAAGLAPIAVGTETDGSIVCPASACGIVGIKPTLGLVSRSGIVPISLAQDTAGPMTRSVADAAALLSVLVAADPADPATASAAAAGPRLHDVPRPVRAGRGAPGRVAGPGQGFRRPHHRRAGPGSGCAARRRRASSSTRSSCPGRPRSPNRSSRR